MLNSLDMTSDDPEELRSANRLLSDEVKALKASSLYFDAYPASRK